MRRTGGRMGDWLAREYELGFLALIELVGTGDRTPVLIQLT